MRFLFLLLLAIPGWDMQHLAAQSYNMNGSSIIDCNGSFYDSGGSSGNYGNNQSLTTTICSDGASGTHVRLDFSGVDLDAGDEICFYDGTSTSANLLSCSGDYTPGQPFIVQATAVNASGCLTLSFNSDASGVASGWSAVISCVKSCQQVLADLVETNPAAIPADTGWIDVCPGERIFFNGEGIYPQNGFSYQQSDLTTTFEWNFGDGDIAYGPAVSHRFQEPGGYYVQMILTDVEGCRSTNLVNQRIRVAPRPDFNLTGAFLSTICAGDTIHLSASVDSASGKTLLVSPNPSAFAVEGSRADSLALPDGTGVPYETTIYLTEFSPGQVLANPLDLESICVNMEHSWMRDMEISITCPNGQSAVLHNFGGQTGSQVFLGVPNDNDGFNPVPGLGYDYCWTPVAPNPTWLQYSNTILGGNGTLPAGDYTPFESFNNLVGCPLNGEWTITVLDLWPIDNGYIFSWSIKFNSLLYPEIESFTPEFVSWQWNSHPSVFFNSPDSIAAAPQNAGTAGYVFAVTDDFGCVWDTLVNVSVLPFTHPACFSCNNPYNALRDTIICAGESVSLNGAFTGPASQQVQFEAFPDYKLGNANHPHNTPFLSPLAVSSLGYSSITNAALQIASVCVDIETDFDADLNFALRSPDNKELLLSSGNGGSGDNYKITCFTSGASTPIIGSTAPFNGSYMPEGAWTTLNGALAAGNWKLVVSDGFGINQYGKVKWWSISFNVPTNINYTWTNAGSLSCGNCPDPMATPAATTSYILSSVDNFACSHNDTVVVVVNDFLLAPGNLNVSVMGADFMSWSWDPVPGASGYVVSINGGPFEPANGGDSHTLTGLVPGQTIDIEVKSDGNNPDCPPQSSIGSQLFFPCNLSLSVSGIQPVKCAGASTGSAVVTASNGSGAVQFFLDGSSTGLPNGNFVNSLSAGSHTVIAIDTAGCQDTISFNIGDVPPININISSVNVLCHADNSGSATATATGGTGSLTYAWNGCAGGGLSIGPGIIDLFAGCYAVTVTDGNGCTQTSSVTITEPPAFIFNSSQDSVNCFGASDGAATIFVTGGQMPYSYLWDNGETTQTAVGLNAGFHFVTVTDNAQCQAATFVIVLQPSQLLIDSVMVQHVRCFGENNGSATVFPRGGTKPYSYQWSDMQATKTASGLVANAYSITVTDTKGCTAAATVNINQPPDLTAQFANVANERCDGACDGSAAVLASGGNSFYSYAWNGPTVVPFNTQNAANLCPGTYTVTITDIKGCTEVISVPVAPAIPIDITLNAQAPQCFGVSDGQISAQVSGGVMPYNYLWNTGASSATIQNLNCATNYTLTVTDFVGCTLTDARSLLCPPQILVNSITAQNAPCFGEASGQITLTASGGTGQLSYKWSDAAQQTTTVAVNLLAGAYTVTITDGNGCTTTATQSVGQPPQLSVTTSASDALCFGQSTGSVTASAGGGVSPYTFTWNNSQIGAVLSNLPAGTYTPTVTDANDCVFTGPPVVVGQPATGVTAMASQTQTACFGASNGAALASGSGSNGGPFSFVWNNNQQQATASGLTAGVYTVTVSDNKGCTSTTSINIAQWDSIFANIIVDQPSCFGIQDGRAAVNMVEGGAGAGSLQNYDYQWNIAGTGNQLTVDGLAGDLTYLVTVTDNEGCFNVFEFYLNQPGAIQIITAVENVSCFGLSDGSASVVSIQGGNQISTYSWSNGEQTKDISNLPEGNFTLTVTDIEGCQGFTAVEVTQPDPLSMFFEKQELYCSGDSNAIITVKVNGGTPAYKYDWSNGGNTETIGNLKTGVFTVTVTDQNNCTLIDSSFIIDPGAPNVQTESEDVRCFGASNGRISLQVNGGAPPYRYSLDGIDYFGASTFIGLEAGTYTIYIRDKNGCLTSTSAVVGQPSPVEVTLGADTTLMYGDSIQLSPAILNAVGFVYYEWLSALVDDIRCVDSSTCSTAWVKPELTNTYTVIVTDENGCEGESSVRIKVDIDRGVYVPTGFTPDNNGANDLLHVFGKSRMVKNISRFRVFDRWGELLYEDQNFTVNDETRGWNGTFRGKDCAPDVYVWYLEVEYLDGFKEVIKGNTMLIR